MVRPQPSPNADALWNALRRSKEKGLSTEEAVSRKLASEPYARRRLRLWKDAGYLTVVEGLPGVTSHRYFMAEHAPKIPPMITAAGVVMELVPAMTPTEFAAIRRKLGLSLAGMAARLGWTGLAPSRSRAARRFENGDRLIDPDLAAKIRALQE